MDAEHTGQPQCCFFYAGFRNGIYKYPSLLPDDLPGDLPQGMANICHQLFFKKRAVETFEMDLGILDKNGMFHVVIFSCIYAKM